MKLGSLFDGSGGFPLSGSLCGIEPIWAAEVEPYPIAVTRSRFPNMKHLGDISKVNGAEIEPVDVITFGSPCQDLSVAGKRAGLKHEANGDEETTRSGLFMEAVRIIKEMREATGGRFPRWALWENVPGAFSSNKGADFRVVLEELIRIIEPGAVMPPVPKAGWAYADSYTGDGWSLAYRVFDAQYWGVPQRRRRIHLVVDFADGAGARKVLFERPGVRGYFAEGCSPWQGLAGIAADRPGADDRQGEGLDGAGRGRLDAVGADVYNLAITGDIVGSLTAGGYTSTGSSPKVLQRDPVAYGVTAKGNGEAFISKERHPSLTAGGGLPGQSYPAAMVPITDTHILDDQGGQSINVRTDGKSPTLRAQMGGHPPVVMQPAAVYAVDQGGGKSGANVHENKAPTLCTTHGGEPAVAYGADPVYIVRRLTPTECARLQGFADHWGRIDKKDQLTDEEYSFWLEVRNTHAAINGKKVQDYTKPQMLTWYNKLHTDSAEYKMWGNGIALPPALYCMQGIVEAMDREEDDSWLM